MTPFVGLAGFGGGPTGLSLKSGTAAVVLGKMTRVRMVADWNWHYIAEIEVDGTSCTGSDYNNTLDDQLNIWSYSSYWHNGSTGSGNETYSQAARGYGFDVEFPNDKEFVGSGYRANIYLDASSGAGTVYTYRVTAYFANGMVVQKNYYPNSDAPTGNFNNRAWQDFGAFNVAASAKYLWYGNRGCWGGGYTSGDTNQVSYVTVSTTGNATDLCDLTQSRRGLGACGSNDGGGFWAGGETYNIIDYVVMATGANAEDFGDLTTSRAGTSGLSSGNRGVFGGGESPTTNTIDYVTLRLESNATDFGDLTVSRYYPGALCDGITGVFGGGGGPNTNVMDYITVDTTGNATDFGDLTNDRRSLAGSSSADGRGVFGGGYGSSADDTIDYITIATAGNATDFGNLTQGRYGIAGLSNGTRAVWAGGETGGWASNQNTIDYVTIASTSDATDFGDLISTVHVIAGCSGD